LRWRAEVRGATQRSSGDTNRSSPSRAPTCIIELRGDIFVRSADECSAMPNSTIGVVGQDLSKRFVGAPATFDRRGLPDRRAHQGMPESD
jgi:hypothetical protein